MRPPIPPSCAQNMKCLVILGAIGCPRLHVTGLSSSLNPFDANHIFLIPRQEIPDTHELSTLSLLQTHTHTTMLTGHADMPGSVSDVLPSFLRQKRNSLLSPALYISLCLRQHGCLPFRFSRLSQINETRSLWVAMTMVRLLHN